jgi:hypothetical protein
MTSKKGKVPNLNPDIQKDNP